jgi:hypothetical protein
MTKVYEFSEFERDDLVYNFATLNSEDVEDKQKVWAIYG